MNRLVLWIQTLTILVDQGLWTQVSVLHLSCAKAASDMTPEMISEQDLRSSFKFSKMSKGKYHSLPVSISGIYYSHDMPEALLKNDFPEFSGQLNIEEFFQRLFEVERFFEYREISDKKKVKLLTSLRKVHGIGGSNCKECVLD